jgi:hypothetical protein
MNSESFLLHHYTSGHGLLGVLNDSQIWATSIHQLNDAREFAHAVDLAKSAIRDAVPTGIPQFELLADSVLAHLDSIAKWAVYVVCFSEVEDSLSQWRGYCPPNLGYSIGFFADRLRQSAQPQGFRLERCIYDPVRQREAANQWAQRTLQALLSLVFTVKDIPALVSARCPLFLEDFATFAPLLKDGSFEDEREWRLVGTVPSNDPRLLLRVGRSMLVRYLPLTLPLNDAEPLVWNVRVGPTPHPELAVDAVCHFFNKVRIKNGVTRSRIPYRDW